MSHLLSWALSGSVLALSSSFFKQPDKPLPGSTLHGQKPLVIGHRGASAYRPEHTLAAYQLAMEMGADFIEPDLVISKDGFLIVRHEPNIVQTTDVASRPAFADRRRSKLVDGRSEEGYFAEDFTLAEIKTLRTVQSLPDRDQSFNGQFPIPTFAEVIELVKAYEAKTGRKVGIYPETKHPSYFRSQGLPLEEKLIETLIAQGFTDPQRIFIQSFEVGNLKDVLAPALKARGLAFPLVQLMGSFTAQPYDFQLAGRKETYGDLAKAENLKNFVASYARGIGPWKGSFILRSKVEAVDLNGDGQAEATESLTGEVLPLIADAHAAGLLVHPYTLRSEERYQAVQYKEALDEYRSLIELGVDGFFTDFPDTGVAALKP